MVKDISYYKQLYTKTALEYLEKSKNDISQLLRNLHNKEAINDSFINMHSLKSQSLAMGYSKTAELPSLLSEIFSQINEGKKDLSEELLMQIMTSLQNLTKAVENIKNENNETDLSEDIKKIKEISDKK